MLYFHDSAENGNGNGNSHFHERNLNPWRFESHQHEQKTQQSCQKGTLTTLPNMAQISHNRYPLPTQNQVSSSQNQTQTTWDNNRFYSQPTSLQQQQQQQQQYSSLNQNQSQTHLKPTSLSNWHGYTQSISNQWTPTLFSDPSFPSRTPSQIPIVTIPPPPPPPPPNIFPHANFSTHFNTQTQTQASLHPSMNTSNGIGANNQLSVSSVYKLPPPPPPPPPPLPSISNLLQSNSPSPSPGINTINSHDLKQYKLSPVNIEPHLQHQEIKKQSKFEYGHSYMYHSQNTPFMGFEINNPTSTNQVQQFEKGKNQPLSKPFGNDNYEKEKIVIDLSMDIDSSPINEKNVEETMEKEKFETCDRKSYFDESQSRNTLLNDRASDFLLNSYDSNHKYGEKSSDKVSYQLNSRNMKNQNEDKQHRVQNDRDTDENATLSLLSKKLYSQSSTHQNVIECSGVYTLGTPMLKPSHSLKEPPSKLESPVYASSYNINSTTEKTLQSTKQKLDQTMSDTVMPNYVEKGTKDLRGDSNQEKKKIRTRKSRWDMLPSNENNLNTITDVDADNVLKLAKSKGGVQPKDDYSLRIRKDDGDEPGTHESKNDKPLNNTKNESLLLNKQMNTRLAKTRELVLKSIKLAAAKRKKQEMEARLEAQQKKSSASKLDKEVHTKVMEVPSSIRRSLFLSKNKDSQQKQQITSSKPDITALSQRIIIRNISKSGDSRKVRIEEFDLMENDQNNINDIGSKPDPTKGKDNKEVETVIVGKENKRQGNELKEKLERLKQQLAAKVKSQKEKLVQLEANSKLKQKSLQVDNDIKEKTFNQALNEKGEDNLKSTEEVELKKSDENCESSSKNDVKISPQRSIDGLRKRQRELRNEIDLSKMKRIRNQQQELLLTHSKRLKESLSLLNDCTDKIEKGKEKLSIEEDRLKVLERKKMIMENMLSKVSQKLMSARKALRDRKLKQNAKNDTIRKTHERASSSRRGRKFAASDFF